MKIVDKLNELKKSQNELLNKFSQIISEAEKSDNIVENEKLRDKVAKLDKSLNEIEKKYKKILDENQKLKLSLNEQIIDEKLNILKVSQEKLDLYFGKSKANNQNNLKKMEFEIKGKIDKFRRLAEGNLSDDKKETLKEIGDLEVKLSEKIKKQREKLKEAEDSLLKDIKKGIKDLSDKDIDEETIQKRIRQNKLEMKIGLSWLNKIGMVLIIIAIAITAYYLKDKINTYLNAYVKGILFFSIGTVFLGLGEFFYRKQKEVFATGLLGGGIAILYSAIFFSYFLLKENGTGIINTPTALILSVVVSLTAIALAIRYDSKTIISIGLIGGYLPFLTYSIAFGFKGTELYYGMSYLFILNLLVLAISFWKQWRVSNYISFLLNIPSMIYLLDGSPSKLVALIYAVLTFAMYLAITLAYPLIYKKALKIPDLILLGLNTFTSSVIFYLLFEELKWNDFYGLLALVICLIYAGLGYFTNKVMKAEKGSIIIFYLTSLTFAVLMIPLQFGRNWFTLGWLVEGTLLVVYGYKKNIKSLETAGWAIFGLCLIAFYFFDLIAGQYSTIYFKLKYLFVTIGTVLVLVVYQLDLVKNKLSEFSLRGKFIRGFKYFTIVTFYLFLIFMTFHYYDKFFSKWTYKNNIFPYYLYKFYGMILFALITMGLGLLLKRVKLFYDNVVKIFSIVLFLIADFLCFIIILSRPLLSQSILNFTENSILQYISVFILIVYNVIVIFSLRDLIVMLLDYIKSNLEFYPLWVGIILFLNITGFITGQLHLNNVSIYIGFAYIILAVLSIIYGFRRKYIYVRFFGLAVIFIALLILFLKIFIDADVLGRIISFFGFGILLLLISFMYQIVNKNIDKTISDESKK